MILNDQYSRMLFIFICENETNIQDIKTFQNNSLRRSYYENTKFITETLS